MNRLFILWLLPWLGFSQLEHKNTISLDTTSQEELFNRAKLWADKASKVPETIIRLDDLDSGIIILSISYKYRCRYRKGYNTHSGMVSYNMELKMRDGQYTYNLYGFKHPTQGLLYDTKVNPGKFSSSAERKYHDMLWRDIITKTKSEIKRISQSLDTAMQVAIENEKP